MTDEHQSEKTSGAVEPAQVPVAVPETGSAEVDTALAPVADVLGRDVNEHPEVFQTVQTELRRLLDNGARQPQS